MSDLTRYMAFRASFYRELDDIRARMNTLLSYLVSSEVSVQDIALVEATHFQEQCLLREFEEMENELIQTLVEQPRRAPDGDQKKLPLY